MSARRATDAEKRAYVLQPAHMLHLVELAKHLHTIAAKQVKVNIAIATEDKPALAFAVQDMMREFSRFQDDFLLMLNAGLPVPATDPDAQQYRNTHFVNAGTAEEPTAVRFQTWAPSRKRPK